MGTAADPSADRLRRANRVTGRLRVAPGVDLATLDTRSTPGLPRAARPAVGGDGKAWTRAELVGLGDALRENQERLVARARASGDRRRVLLVLQALDCGGKDGAIKAVAGAMNPLGVRISAFGQPTPVERAHGFLWRIRRALPGPGMVAIFNRSHYEDVLAARVRGRVPERTWRPRFDEINQFEQEIAADGATIIKIMLHISADEQRQRLLARLDDPTKRWKFNPGDLGDRALWSEYACAYTEVLQRCDRDVAPWYVVPADRKWYRDWAVINVLLATLAQMRLEYPPAPFDVARQRERLRNEG